MINHFKTVCANDQSMRPVIVDGREWTLCTISKYDHLDEAGGHPRAQYVSLPKTGEKEKFNFDIMIQEWDKNADYVNFHDLHCSLVKGIVYGFYVVDDTFKAVMHTESDQRGAVIEYAMRWIPGHPYEFRLNVDIARNGVIDCEVNGQTWFRYKGRTLFEGDESPYFKVGPYQANGNWLETEYRKMLVRI